MDPHPLHLTRVPAPAWVREQEFGYSDASGAMRALGEQQEWGYAVPMMWRALASPATWEPFVAAPARQSDHVEATGYWAALLNLLFYSFGWRRPDVGLRWARRSGSGEDDLRLRMIRDVWEADGQLDWMLAFLERAAAFKAQWPEALGEVMGGPSGPPLPPPDIERLERAAKASGIPDPISGGGDPLHLLMHVDGPARDDPEGRWHLLRSGEDDRTAVLQVETLTGWYRLLTRAGQRLPDLGQRSWHVHVHVQTAGYLGAFRRSRSTGLWFSGPHRLHLVGNP